MKRKLGLDLGTNSIGWAVVEEDENAAGMDNREQEIENDGSKIRALGSRIIPMDAATLGDFEKGNLQSPASERTGFRSMRRVNERSRLRRERLLRVLNVLGFLPEHFAQALDFECRLGKFADRSEPLIAYKADANGRRQFVFMDAFHEMLQDFGQHQPELVADGKLVPYDWTIYYLRQKAVHEAITPQELSWLLLHFNAKRGYYHQLGDSDLEEEQEGQPTKREEYKELTVVGVKQLEADKKRPGSYWYEITYDNGVTKPYSAPVPPRRIGDKVEVIVTTTLDKTGEIKKDKEGHPAIKLRAPKEDDWTLMKKRTEHELQASGGTVGEYIYNHLLANPNVKVRGKLIHTIERSYYKDELRLILDKQSQCIPQLADPYMLERCARELYRQNENHVQALLRKDFTNLFVEDILFYQRPLKSKRGEIDDCPYESRYYVDKETGELVRVPLKCIARSHPLYQEFRLWQFVSDLRIYKRQAEVNGKIKLDVDVTTDLLPDEASRAALFDWLSQKGEIKQDQLLKYPPFGLKKQAEEYRWNYVEDRAYPCDKTGSDINRRCDKAGVPHLSADDRLKLWNIAYSIKDTEQRTKAFRKFASERSMDPDNFVKAFSNYAPSEDTKDKGYGAYSEKAVKKLLSLMRAGNHWAPEAIDTHTRQRIDHLIDGEADDSISNRVRKMALEKRLDSIGMFSGLSVWEACYVVYDRHSEAADLTRWENPSDIDTYIGQHLRHNSLRNPIVEKVVVETLKVVRDVWRAYGHIDEVHIEMGRDLKNPAQKRAADTERIMENERTNLRIRALLQEFAKPQYGIEGVRPHSPMQQEILKLYEEEVLGAYADSLPDDVRKIIDDLGSARRATVKSTDILRYRLWLEQKYQSPYTGKTIPLSRLFTREYEIEHVIPRSRYFDDSLQNKVICETEVNRHKGNMLGYEYIIHCGGSILQVTRNGKPDTVTVFDRDQYTDFVSRHYARNWQKRKRLLMEDIPDGFIQRQLNDSRYMSRKMQSILSCLVREEGEPEATSKHVISTQGRITDQLKADWGLKDVWNQLITPRFERLNRMTNTQDYGQWVEREGKRFFQINVPIEISQGFSKKRIDHRHHAMDAIVIACTTRDHINYLNNKAALKDERKGRDDLRRKLCYKLPPDAEGDYTWTFRKPWKNFTQDVRQALQGVVVSFKQNLRIINKTSNFYTHYDEAGRKVVVKQVKGDGWAIRKSLHKATMHGLVRLQVRKTLPLSKALEDWPTLCDKALRQEVRRVVASYGGRVDAKTLARYFRQRGNTFRGQDISRVDVWRYTEGDTAMTATRVALSEDFKEAKIDKVTDSGIRQILKAHLHHYDDEQGHAHPEQAFSPQGIAAMNENLRQLNGGRDHKPILKVRVAEAKGMKFPVGEAGSKSRMFVEADKGTNLFFAIYVGPDGKRSFETIPFNMAVERMKQGAPVAPEFNAKGQKLLFTLSPNDLVYVPKQGEEATGQLCWERIYKMVSCSEISCQFIPMSSATVIVQAYEYESHNKMEKTIDDGVSIKNVCLKLTVDRLGRITHIIGRQ